MDTSRKKKEARLVIDSAAASTTFIRCLKTEKE